MDLGSEHLLHGDLVEEECWSEGGTYPLIEVWSDRYLRLNRVSLQQKDWVEVAEAVNERLEVERMLPKTDTQCKNRIESLKKQYEIEKAKPGLSQWPFLSCLHLLINNDASESHSLPSPLSRLQNDQPLPKRHISPASAVNLGNPDPCEATFGLGSYHEGFVDGNYAEGIDNEEKEGNAEYDGEQDRELGNPDPCGATYGLESYHEEFVDGNYAEGIDNEEKEGDAEDDGEQNRELGNPDPYEATTYGLGSYHEEFADRNYAEGIDNEEKEGDAEDDGKQDHEANDLFGCASIGKRQRKMGQSGSGIDDGFSGGDGAFGGLARAIMKFKDVYERVETSKQKQMMEIEIKRMEFAKDLELMKMRMFMEAQIIMEKLKRDPNFPGI